jgi:hypothetical protein
VSGVPSATFLTGILCIVYCIKLRRDGRVLEQIYLVGCIADDTWLCSGRGTVSGSALVQNERSDVTPWSFSWQAI